MLRAVVKHFSPTRVHKSQFWPFSTEQGRCFFHCGCMPGTGAIRWGDISFRTRLRRPIEPPILTHRTRDQQTGGTGVMGTEGHGRGAGGRQHGQNKHTRPKPHPIGGRRGACGARPRSRWAAAGSGRASSRRAQPHTATRRRRCGGRRRDRRVRPRCRWAAAGPGRASRSTTPSRQARVWRSRGRAAAHGRTQRPGPKNTRGAQNTSGTQRAPPQEKETPTAPGTP